jgi:hypothetical protein
LHEILVTIMNILKKLLNSAFENFKNISIPSELIPVVEVYPQLVVTASDYFGSNVKCNTIHPKKACMNDKKRNKKITIIFTLTSSNM